jgi:hypothetical protein
VNRTVPRFGFGAAVIAIAAALPAAAVELAGPEVIKVGWNSGSMVADDVDGDGRNDLVIINNDRARIELHLQREPGTPVGPARPSGLERWQPVLSDARFERRSIATGNRMFALTTGDLDGNGRTDIAYTGVPEGLTVEFQNHDGEFDRRRVFDIGDPVGLRGTVEAADVDDDGRTDIVVLTKSELIVYRQNADHGLEGPESWKLAGSCFALEILDLDGDGLVDISYQASEASEGLRVRHGLEGGGFGPEVDYPVGPTRGVMRSIPSETGPESEFVRIQDDTGLVERLVFSPPKPASSILSNARPRVFAVPVDRKEPACHALGDLDGDRLLDMVVADPRGARLWLIRQQQPGVFAAAEDFPSLAGVSSLIAADRDRDGSAELIMASPKERTLAWTRLTPDGTLALPSAIATQARPLAVATADLDDDGHLDLAYASAEKRERRLVVASGSSGWEDQTAIEIAELDTDPTGLRVVDLNGDGLDDLVLFVGRGALRLIVQNADRSFREIDSDAGFRRALVDGVDPSAVTTGDVTGDGVDEMIIASQGYARALRLDGDDQLRIVGQFNGRSSDADLAAACALGLRERAGGVVALVEPSNDRIQVLGRHRGNVWRFVEHVGIPAIDLVGAAVVDLDASGNDDLVLFGSDRLVWIPVGKDDPELAGVSSWEPDLDRVAYSMLGVGDLNADGRSEVVAVDTRDTHVLEVLRPGSKGEWRSLVHFTVFEVDPHYEGQRGAVNQPREIVIADLTDDGRDDLALVVHDRVLLYPQVAE